MHLGGNRRLGAPDERSAINDNLREYILFFYAMLRRIKCCERVRYVFLHRTKKKKTRIRKLKTL